MTTDQISSTAIDALPLGRLRLALQDSGAYLVGGVTRTMFGAEALADDDIDIAIDGELEPILVQLERQGFGVRRHDRFATATVTLDTGVAIDLARTRAERYEHPGDLPVVRPAPIEEDLARRDFSINAIAVSLDSPHRILDPYEGRSDLRLGILRALHELSFADDPTRALRAARYASRLGLVLDPLTEEWIRATDLKTVSADRRQAELRRLAAEPDPKEAFARLADWGLLRIRADDLALVEAVVAESRRDAWTDLEDEERLDAIIAAAGVGREKIRARALALAPVEPATPSAAVADAARHSAGELLLAAAVGASWLREYMAIWRHVSPAIDGNDLIAAGVPAGPRIGRALDEVRRKLLDGKIGEDRTLQLAVALEAAEEPG